MTEIVVVCPVLDRAHRAQPLVDSFTASTPEGLARMVFVCSPGDVEQILACQATGADVLVTDWAAGHGDFARKIQLAFDSSDEPFLFQAADDVTFQPGWAEAALATIEPDFGVCATNDDANPTVKAGRHGTHSLIRRSYIDECGGSWDGPGTVFSTAYSHQWTDNELCELAKSRGCFTFAADSHVTHAHPIWGTADDDETYRKGQRHGREDRALFVRRQRLWKRAA